MGKPSNYKEVITTTEGLSRLDLAKLNETMLEIDPEDTWIRGLKFWEQRKLYLKLKGMQVAGKLLTKKI